jgi:predicted nucleic acid-binding protein
MPVLDASVVVDALVVAGPAGDLGRDEMRRLTALQAPAIFTAEVTSALRGLVQRRALSPIRATAALTEILSVRTLSYPFEPFARRVWELRDSLTVYDAWYVALAERLETELVTGDKRLADASGPRCTVRYLDPGGQRPRQPTDKARLSPKRAGCHAITGQEVRVSGEGGCP